MNDNNEHNQLTGLEIAIIGLNGRFPGAADIDMFWENLKNGVESFTFYSDEELIAAGVDSELLNNPGYVKTDGGLLEDKTHFDAGFFGFKPLEAELMDPQTRVFMESTWHALEHAGYGDPASYDGLIGLYAGSGQNFYWEALAHVTGRGQMMGSFAATLFTWRDMLCTRASYQIGLKGPSVYIKTACSTALVAIHIASQAILNGECDMAVAGGVSIMNYGPSGYLYQEGMISSPDGHCRAFDAEGKGTVGGEGVGIVVLKRLEDALADGDTVHAVIKGSAINNDGARKIGYTAPSVSGQVDVIRDAFQVADVDPETITYVETHGTATPVGDPIEIESLVTAYETDKKGYCRIGSVKTNIGHLDAGAGVAGLIKVILSLKNKQIPPSLHYKKPNPNINFEDSPFRVAVELSVWERCGGLPLRAGVSSFGIGGTNAHIILEEAPAPARDTDTDIPQLLLLSARSGPALEQLTADMAAFLRANPGLNLADVAHTLQRGRKAFNHRRTLVASSPAEAAEALEAPANSRKVRDGVMRMDKRPVVFMFSGLGAQYVNMGRELYHHEPVFREVADRCFELIAAGGGGRLKESLYPADAAAGGTIPAETAQTLLFVFEVALARLMMSWGIQPAGLIGYSFGEYAAACIAGVLTLEDALALVLHRNRIVAESPGGGMLSVPMPEKELRPLLDDFNRHPPEPGMRLSLAIDNGPSCLVSGPGNAIEAFEARMKERRAMCVRISATHGLHSFMMEPVAPKLEEALGQLTFNEPEIPYVSNVTGAWITPEQASSPRYWGDHLKGTVRFADGVRTLLAPGDHWTGGADNLFLEIGPGYDLCTLLRHHVEDASAYVMLNPVPQAPIQNRPSQPWDDTRYLLNRLGRLWMEGVPVDWDGYYGEKVGRRRIPLPLYPFQRREYMLEGSLDALASGEGVAPAAPASTAAMDAAYPKDPADWLYVPTWKRVLEPPVPAGPPGVEDEKSGAWLIFCDEAGVGRQAAQILRQRNCQVVTVECGAQFQQTEEGNYRIDPAQPAQYRELFAHVLKSGLHPANILHLWSITAGDKSTDELLDLGFYSLIYLVQAASRESMSQRIQLGVGCSGLFRVTGDEVIQPGKAAVLGAVRVIPREYGSIDCRLFELQSPVPEGSAARLLRQFPFHPPTVSAVPSDAVAHETVALRGNYRWVQVYEPAPQEPAAAPLPQLKEKGVYLVTGGLGGIGLELAAALVDEVKARLVLTGQSEFPPREQWDQWLSSHNEDDRVSRRIGRIRELEASGAEVLVYCAEATDIEAVRAAVTGAKDRFGTIDGVIHAAGIPDGGLIPLRTRDSMEPVLAPKIKGTLVLDRVLKDAGITPDFMVFCSSITAVLGLFGQVAYCAANAFQDVFASCKTLQENVYTVSIGWDMWNEVGMGVETLRRLVEEEGIADSEQLMEHGLSTSQGVDLFRRILSAGYPHTLVSPVNLSLRLQRTGTATGATTGRDDGGSGEIRTGAAQGKTYPRPELTTEYEPPVTEFEKTFADVLQNYFGFEQVGIHDNLFEYGITSLDVIHINEALMQKIDKEIPVVVMFEYPTIHSLGHYLEGGETGEEHVDTGPVEDLDEVEDLLHGGIDLFQQDDD